METATYQSTVLARVPWHNYYPVLDYPRGICPEFCNVPCSFQAKKFIRAPSQWCRVAQST